MKFLFILHFFLAFCFALSCQDLKNNPALLKNIDLNDKATQELIQNCDISLKNQAFLKELYKITNQIRGTNINCLGDIYMDKLQAFNALLLQIALDPIEYQKSLKSMEENANKSQALRAYFRYWAYQSIGNFKLYKAFWSEYNKAKNELEIYFKKNFNFDEASNIYYAQNAINEFLFFAVGDTKIYADISPLAKFVSNKNYDSIALKDYLLKNSFSKNELTLGLHAALLNARESAVISLLLDYGASIDEGYESAIFFALEDAKNVKFLLERGANINASNVFGKSALFYAIEFNLEETLNLLLENGADINAKFINSAEKLAISSSGAMPYFITLCALEHTGKTLFMHAAEFGDEKLLAKLINLGANAYEIDDLGFNALDFALLANKTNNAIFLENLGLKANSFNSKNSENFYQGEAQ